MSHAQRPRMLPTVSGNWGALAVRGVAAVLFGLAALIWPGLTLAVLIILYGAYAVVDGTFAIVAGLRAGSGTRTWLLLAEGALGILAGLVAVFWPSVTAVFLLYIIAFWAIFGGLLRIVGGRIAEAGDRQRVDHGLERRPVGAIGHSLVRLARGWTALPRLAHRYLRARGRDNAYRFGFQGTEPRPQWTRWE